MPVVKEWAAELESLEAKADEAVAEALHKEIEAKLWSGARPDQSDRNGVPWGKVR